MKDEHDFSVSFVKIVPLKKYEDYQKNNFFLNINYTKHSAVILQRK
jgi:hypothetical protein